MFACQLYPHGAGTRNLRANLRSSTGLSFAGARIALAGLLFTIPGWTPFRAPTYAGFCKRLTKSGLNARTAPIICFGVGIYIWP